MEKTNTVFFDSPNGKIIRDITYVKDSEVIRIKAGTLARIDEAQGIALVGKDHIFVYEGEYEIFLN